jgi:alpha-1,6-mannosyltransferase
MTELNPPLLRPIPFWLRMILYVLLFGFVFTVLCYIPRSNTPMLLWTMAATVLVFVVIGYHGRSISWREILIFSVAIRLGLLYAPVNWSDDIYRFFWDGLKVRHLESPYHSTPIDDHRKSDWPELFNRMNSASYYSPYPPVCQYIWAITSNPTGDPVYLRIVFILFDILNIWLLYRLLEIYGRPSWHVIWYAFNPFVLMEGIGQLHPELLVVTCMLSLIWAIRLENCNAAGFAMGLAICTKLWPAIAFILLYPRMPLQQWLKIAGIALGVCIVLYAPLLNLVDIESMCASFLLYFSAFEFNASLYYLIKECVIFFNPEASGAWISKIMGVGWMIYIVWLSRKRSQELPLLLYAAFGTQLLLSAVVHPWYLLPVLVYGLLAGHWASLVWSMLVFLSYSHYCNGGFQEQPLFIFIEYALLLLALGLEYQIKLSSQKTIVP